MTALLCAVDKLPWCHLWTHVVFQVLQCCTKTVHLLQAESNLCVSLDMGAELGQHCQKYFYGPSLTPSLRSFWCCTSLLKEVFTNVSQASKKKQILGFGHRKRRLNLASPIIFQTLQYPVIKAISIAFWTITWITCPGKNSRNHLWCVLRSESFVVPFHLNCWRDQEGNAWNRCP